MRSEGNNHHREDGEDEDSVLSVLSVVQTVHGYTMEDAMATAVETQWTEDVDQALSQSKKSGKALLIDFTAAPM